MKKQILEALKAKFEGVSEAVLSRIADKLAKTATTEEAVATAVEGVTFQTVLDSYGDSRATEASQTAVGNYEKKHGLKDGQKVQGGAPVASEPEDGEGEEEDDPKTPAWAKTIIKNQKAIDARFAALEGEKVTSTRKQQLEAIVSKLPENLRKPYARVAIPADMSDEDFATMTAEITTEVDGLLAEASTKGAVFGRPLGGGAKVESGKEATEQECDELAKRLIK
jgi:hypothetical protein